MEKPEKIKILKKLERVTNGLECILNETDKNKINKYMKALIKITNEAKLDIDPKNEIIPAIQFEEITK